MKTLFLALRSVIYMSGFLLFFGWIALLVRTFDQSFGVSLPAASEIPGAILVVVGAILVLACAGVFISRGRGTPAIFDAPRAFVAIGPYKYVRNPMYIGGLVLLIGFGLYERSISILFLTLPLFLLVHSFVLFYEEPTLTRKFGSSYQEYRRAVRRWIPRLTCS
ncbi:MAG: isoprenylcysteine carboxylmethyltransferase family protein [Terriglobia bacterium]|jgi:protein-S-isoprenylcysteine O-methyltransferase Ste14